MTDQLCLVYSLLDTENFLSPFPVSGVEIFYHLQNYFLRKFFNYIYIIRNIVLGDIMII